MSEARVEIDVLVLDAVATDLAAYAGQVDALQSRALALAAGHITSRLASGADWAVAAAADVRERAELVRSLDAPGLETLSALGISVLDVAGARGQVPDLLMLASDAHQLQTAGASQDLGRRSNESLDDWFDRLLTDALARVPLAGGLAEPLVEALEWYRTYGNLVVAAAATTTGAWRLGAYVAAPRLAGLLGTAETSRLPGFVHRFLTNRVTSYGTLRAPQSVIQLGYRASNLVSEVVGLERGVRPPWLGGGAFPTWAQRAGALTGNVFGRPLLAADGTVIASRGATNLLSVAAQAPSGSRVATTARTAGALRGLGIVGSGAATVYSAANVLAQGNMADAFEREGAGYVADLAELGFNASLTATLIAPNPFTVGATVVTGAVWAGAELVDHWDEVTDAADQAVDWAQDRVGDVTGAIADTAGDAVDAVRESELNPMNWF